MRSMVRNQRAFYYAQYVGKNEMEDEYGNKTGQYELVYSNPKKCYANISAAQGETQSRQFGDSEIYDRVIVLDRPDTGIDEYSILWVDTPPVINSDGTTSTPYDYVVKKIGTSLNTVSIAISKVNVRG